MRDRRGNLKANTQEPLATGLAHGLTVVAASGKVDIPATDSDLSAEPRMKGTVRLNLQFPGEMKKRLDSLRGMMGVGTITETVATSLRVAEWYFKARSEQRRVLVESKDGSMREVEFM